MWIEEYNMKFDFQVWPSTHQSRRHYQGRNVYEISWNHACSPWKNDEIKSVFFC